MNKDKIAKTWVPKANITAKVRVSLWDGVEGHQKPREELVKVRMRVSLDKKTYKQWRPLRELGTHTQKLRVGWQQGEFTQADVRSVGKVASFGFWTQTDTTVVPAPSPKLFAICKPSI